MDTNRNTGLGSSLLLRRTETPPEPATDFFPDVQTPDVVSTPEPEPSLPARIEPEPELTPATTKKPRKMPLVLRDRCTLYLEREVNNQLHVAARIQGRELSEVATDILRKYLPRYRVERE